MSNSLAPEPDETPIRDLLQIAGRRPEPAAFRTARVRLAVEAEWRRSMPRRSPWRFWRLPVAAALTLALVLWGRTSPRQPATPAAAPALATLARVTGAAQVISPGTLPRRAVADLILSARTTVDTTAGGRVALTLKSGASVRIDRHSRLVLEAADRLTLERGTVYVDSGEGARTSDSLRIATRWGLVHEVGTQFEVASAATFVQVRVREGAVRIEHPDASIVVGAAEAVRIRPGGIAERRTIARYGPEWSWIETIPAPFTIEGAALEKFLHWVSREQGWEWQFRDAAAARHGKSVVLHGSIEGLTPAEALEAVLPTCGMTSQLRGARLLVGLAPR